MKIIKRKNLILAFSAIVICACFLFLASCKKKEPAKTPETTVSSKDGTSSNSGSSVPTTPGEPVYDMDLNPLTGEHNIEKGASVRPVAFMISNIYLNHEQPGIHDADFYLDLETEGGVSRIMTVFTGIDRVPGRIGPIRSARSPYIKIADSIGAIYCHFGGKEYIRDRIEGTSISDLDGIFNAVSYFIRDDDFDAPNDVTTSQAMIKEAIGDKSFSLEASSAAPFEFLKEGEALSSDQKAENVQVSISSYSQVSFKYDSSTKKYTKHLGDLSDSEVHESYEGNAIKVSNVIVIYAEKFTEDGNNTNFELESGSGLVASGGKYEKVNWSRSGQGFTFTKTDGSSLQLPVGNIYMCVTSPYNEEDTVIN